MIELAELENKELVYGEYEEIEEYCEEKDTCVEHYFDHVNPSTVYKNFKYVGKSLHDPYAVSVQWDYKNNKPDVRDKW